MNILIIGNGFDIAHGLPTTYKDFLKFIEQICRIKKYYGTVKQFESKNESIRYDIFNELHKGVAKYIDLTIRDDKKPDAYVKDIYAKRHSLVIDEIIELAENNIWIKWFQNIFINENWIDFESEISEVIQSFEKIFKLISYNKFSLEDLSERDSKFFALLTQKTTIDNASMSDFKEYKKIIIQDLYKLIRCLELYLEDCVMNIEKSLLSPDIYDLKVDKVLSFNYTDTYARLYSCKNKNIEYDYIHGKSKIAREPANNMVLGIDEYLNDNERNTNTEYIEFKKYFQRIHKVTGTIYKKWIDEINESESTENRIYIFGHSLGITDRDVLKELITNKKVKTTIFYKDIEKKGQQIANLVKVLDQDILISMVYGNNPKIKFVMQKSMIDKQSSEWQILNDINSLRNLYELSTPQANVLINRLSQKVYEKDLSYFNNQKNIISLYDALVSNNLFYEIYGKELLNIASSLFIEDKSAIFNADDWATADYSGTYSCDSRVEDFINSINTYNMRNKNCFKTLLDFDTENLEVLYKQIDKAMSNEETFIELFNYLFNMFDTKDCNAKLIWKCIFKLGKKMPEGKWAEFVDNNMSKSKKDKIKYIRYCHIKDAIDENDYFNHIYEQIEQEDDYETYISVN